MKPRRHSRLLSGLFAHPWYCVRCQRDYPEHQTHKYREVGFDVFVCPVCRRKLGARCLF